jgi:hypothetical protein
MSSINSISPEKLVRLVGVPRGPALIDVRTDADFVADSRLIPGVVRRSHTTVASWAGEFAGRSAVVVSQKGQKLGEGVAAWLRHAARARRKFSLADIPPGPRQVSPWLPKPSFRRATHKGARFG